MLTDRFVELPDESGPCPRTGLHRDDILALPIELYHSGGRTYFYWYRVRRLILDRMKGTKTAYKVPTKFRHILDSFDSVHVDEVPPDARPFAGPYLPHEVDSLGEVVAGATDKWGSESVLLGYTRKAVTVYLKPSPKA